MTGTAPLLWLYDDARARAFEPFALTRPASAMLAGTRAVRDRWMLVFGFESARVLGADHLSGLFDVPAEAYTEDAAEIPAGSVIVNSRCIPVAGSLGSPDAVATGAAVWQCAGRVAAIRTERVLARDEFARGDATLEMLAPSGVASGEIAGWWVDDPWDYIRWLPAQLEDDIMRLARGALGGVQPIPFESPPAHAVVLGEYPVCVLGGAVIEPCVVFDATHGPILIDRKATIHAFTRLVGPCYVGAGSTVLGSDIRGSSIGPVCKVRGEVSTSILVGYANKGHEGFVGHSCIGEWANLGAGTTTSNLKNTYGAVSLQTPSGVRETGMQFLGTLMGDHAKTGIGMRLTTGTIVGAGASIFGSDMPAKLVPPFAWGERAPYGTWELGKFLAVAERVMGRRSVALSPGMRNALARAYEQRWGVAG